MPKRQKLDQDFEGVVLEDFATVKEGSGPTDDEFKLYCSNISQQGTKLSVLSEHSDNNYVSKIHQPECPQSLSFLCDTKYIKLS